LVKVVADRAILVLCRRPDFHPKYAIDAAYVLLMHGKGRNGLTMQKAMAGEIRFII